MDFLYTEGSLGSIARRVRSSMWQQIRTIPSVDAYSRTESVQSPRGAPAVVEHLIV